MTSSLLPFPPARPNLIVTSLKSDKVVFPGPPLRPLERVTILLTLGGIFLYPLGVKKVLVCQYLKG